MSNFKFILDNEHFEIFAKASVEAEKSISISNETCTIMTRRALELAVKWMYNTDSELKMPYTDQLSALIHDYTFKNIIGEKLFNEIKYIVKLGNFSVHSNAKVSRESAEISLKYLFDFMKWISYSYDYDNDYRELEFNYNILENPVNQVKVLTKNERAELESKLNEQNEKLIELIKENEELNKRLTNNRVNSKKIEFSIKDYSEEKTRKDFIDLDLQFAGWSQEEKNLSIEYKVYNMPNKQKLGYIDYVLFGKDGKPLAVVEAKKASKDPIIGQNQAKFYADCLEEEYEQRPIIYYTNGLEIYMWDDLNYPPRKVSGYRTQEELQRLINSRTQKNTLEKPEINQNITNRFYQQEAINRVCETFSNKHRKALLVMATGTGKTRTAISIVDVLTKNNWIKNVLFLADRTDLVLQAEKNFRKLLPNFSTTILMDTENTVEESRGVFSTYQTMINKIDTARDKKGNHLFTPGHFDLIIIDEAHRSIYKKYKFIFEYFDALLVGLTATPKLDVDKNTYDFFELEHNNPTYAYTYEEALAQKYLVDYHTIKTNTKFLNRGIKYSNLSQEDKEEYESMFETEDNIPEQIDSTAINSWVYNKDTIVKIIETLMNKGIKVEDGDKLGKTIIFARNKKHAEKIVDTFNFLYPKYNGKFAEAIYSGKKYSRPVLDDFANKDKLPQIAVSVDMLDTGIDIPEVVNLVFFKPVKSKIKFWQMIGRGTRLCENLFGYGNHKKEFYIFDCCNNFDFFELNENGIESKNTLSITEKINILKLDLIRRFENIDYQENVEFKNYREELVKDFLDKINSLNDNLQAVKSKRLYISHYSKEDNWVHINSVMYDEIVTHIIPLFEVTDNDQDAKRLDNLIYSLQLSKLDKSSLKINKTALILSDLIGELKKVGTLPLVQQNYEIIKEASDENYWKNNSFFELEKTREILRELIKYIDNPYKKSFDINIQDELTITEDKRKTLTEIGDYTNYKKKIENFILEGKNNEVKSIINKIKNVEKLTYEEKRKLESIMFNELGDSTTFITIYGESNLIKIVRKITGVDQKKANEIFSKYSHSNKLNSNQIEFVKMLQNYVMKNGIVNLLDLREDPFKKAGDISEIFKEDGIKIFEEIKRDIELINNSVEI